jgi:protein-L-isoaspartate(D-aspartate) O-methyltransferase
VLECGVLGFSTAVTPECAIASMWFVGLSRCHERRCHLTDPDEVRGFFAKLMSHASKSSDPRLERIFELVPREAFLGSGPWRIQVEGRYIDTPSADLCYIYQNVLVALDESKGINNGEPLLHARWIGAVAPQPGEMVTHIGTGTGYYTALLSILVRPGGRVEGIELEPDLAASARKNLEAFDNTSVTAGDAVALELPPSDIVYVNAGVLAPPAHWLTALRPIGRMIFPWRPAAGVGLALLVTRRGGGLSAAPLMPAWFIPCIGASLASGDAGSLDAASAWRTRSLHLMCDRSPDETATAIYEHVWFSSAPVED